jgi:putative ABC transport system substrate-binding protein
MKRRSLLLALSVSLASATGVAHAADDQERVARVAYVDSASRANALWGWPAFWRRLSELGWTEGRNLIIEARFAEGNADRLPQLFRDVVESKADVIFTYTTTGALAAKEATSTIPVVFAGVIDPIGSGIVASLGRPGQNLGGRARAHPAAPGLSR